MNPLDVYWASSRRNFGDVLAGYYAKRLAHDQLRCH